MLPFIYHKHEDIPRYSYQAIRRISTALFLCHGFLHTTISLCIQLENFLFHHDSNRSWRPCPGTRTVKLNVGQLHVLVTGPIYFYFNILSVLVLVLVPVPGLCGPALMNEWIIIKFRGGQKVIRDSLCSHYANRNVTPQLPLPLHKAIWLP